MTTSIQRAVRDAVASRANVPIPKVRKPRAELQPLAVLQLPDALLTTRTVCAVSSLSESSIRRGVAAGTFPAPVKRGKRCTRWVSRDVTAWLRAQRGEA